MFYCGSAQPSSEYLGAPVKFMRDNVKCLLAYGQREGGAST